MRFLDSFLLGIDFMRTAAVDVVFVPEQKDKISAEFTVECSELDICVIGDMFV